VNCGRKILGLAAAVGIAMAHPATVSACTVCYGGPNNNTPLMQGMGWGILTLLVIVLAVLGGVAGFFFYVIRRGAALQAVAAAPSLPNLNN
jgi:hypothetical protein